MKLKRRPLKKDAKAVLKTCFWTAVAATLIVGLISLAAEGVLGGAFNVFPLIASSTSEAAQNALTDGSELTDPDIFTVTDPDATVEELMGSTPALIAPADNSALVEQYAAAAKTSPLLILFSILVANILEVGLCDFFLKARKGDAQVGNIFNGFKAGYGNNLAVMLLRDVFTLLWSLLFIIPGVIKAYQYSMIPYILAENSDISYKEAFAQSKAMTKGNKWRLFKLDLSFIGWGILCVLTAGIGFIFLVPYYRATKAEAYEALKANA